MRFRRSGMLIIFFTLSATSATNDLHGTARGRNLLCRSGTKFVCLYDQICLQVSFGKDLHSMNSPLNQTLPDQFFRSHDRAGLEHVQLGYVDLGNLLAEDVVEAAFWRPPVQRHLSAFKSTHQRMSRTRSLPLASATSGFPVSGTRATTHPFLFMGGALGRPQPMKFHNYSSVTCKR